MRAFAVEYLEATRGGMWDDSRDVLAPLELASCERVLDAGAGTGALTRVLAEETDGDVVALDANPMLLSHAPAPRVRGDATRLPFRRDSVDLVVCQALLVNVPDPRAVLDAGRRVSRGRVAAIEPDNSAIEVDSTVDAEAPLARRAREAYLAGVDNPAKRGDAESIFTDAGLTDLTVREYTHERVIEPPYSDVEWTEAEKRADGGGLGSDREAMLDGGLTRAEFTSLHEEWCAMGETVLEQMDAGQYRRSERIPFSITVGTV